MAGGKDIPIHRPLTEVTYTAFLWLFFSHPWWVLRYLWTRAGCAMTSNRCFLSPGSRVRRGVLLVNFGTPDSPGLSAVRAFLSEVFKEHLSSVPWPLREWWIVPRRLVTLQRNIRLSGRARLSSPGAVSAVCQSSCIDAHGLCRRAWHAVWKPVDRRGVRGPAPPWHRGAVCRVLHLRAVDLPTGRSGYGELAAASPHPHQRLHPRALVWEPSPAGWPKPVRSALTRGVQLPWPAGSTFSVI